MNIAEIEGIGLSQVEKLARAGIKTPAALIKKGYTPALRKSLAEETGISETQILYWVQFADLLRIEGIGLEYAGLLEEIGVDSSKELAARNAKYLAKRMKEVNAEKNRVHKLPGFKQIVRAIESAKEINSPHGLAGNSTTDAPHPGKKKIYSPRIEY